ncbi:hypothetical protein, partial [Enterobacter asburiae]
HLKIGVSVRHIFKPISYLEIQLLSGVSGGYISAGEGFGQEIQLLLQGIKTLFSFIGHINLRE